MTNNITNDLEQVFQAQKTQTPEKRVKALETAFRQALIDTISNPAAANTELTGIGIKVIDYLAENPSEVIRFIYDIDKSLKLVDENKGEYLLGEAREAILETLKGVRGIGIAKLCEKSEKVDKATDSSSVDSMIRLVTQAYYNELDEQLYNLQENFQETLKGDFANYQKMRAKDEHIYSEMEQLNNLSKQILEDSKDPNIANRRAKTNERQVHLSRARFAREQLYNAHEIRYHLENCKNIFTSFKDATSKEQKATLLLKGKTEKEQLIECIKKYNTTDLEGFGFDLDEHFEEMGLHPYDLLPELVQKTLSDRNAKIDIKALLPTQ